MTLRSNFAATQHWHTLPRLFIRDFLLRFLGFHTLGKLHVTGREHIPASGPTILILNHIAAPDPVIMLGIISRRFVIPLSKVENFSLPIFGGLMRLWGVVPCHRGVGDIMSIKNIIELLRRQHMVLIAPEGSRYPQLVRAREGFVYAAVRTGAAVLPVGIDGTLALKDNFRRMRRTPIHINIGQPLRFHLHGNMHLSRGQLRHMADEAMYRVALLLPEHRRGYYADFSKATSETFRLV